MSRNCRRIFIKVSRPGLWWNPQLGWHELPERPTHDASSCRYFRTFRKAMNHCQGFAGPAVIVRMFWARGGFTFERWDFDATPTQDKGNV